MHDQEFLNLYFSKHWIPADTSRLFSDTDAIGQKIKGTERVLDVGCGQNKFKVILKNVVGVDPAFDQADYKMTIEQFETDQLFDVALCLGSINFGSEEVISRQICKVVSLLTPHARIFWRCNPGRHDHPDPLCRQVEFFPWTFEKLNTFAKQHGFEQLNCNEEVSGKTIRLYAEWHR